MDRDKYIVLVVSGGRTGTMFLGDLLERVVPGAFSVHEPDVFVGLKRKSWERIRRFGLYHMVVGRLLGRTGIRNLTQRFLSGRLSLDELATEIRKHREDYYVSLDEDLIIESYYQWYGILPGVERVFPRYRVVAIVRDPRPWVESWLAHGAHHGPRDRVTKLGFRRLDPEMMDDQEFIGRWDQMSPFEKNCWDWRAIYGTLDEWVESDSNSRLYRFGDLFLSDRREETFRDMLSFITKFPDREFSYQFDPSLFQIRKNPSRDASPAEVAEQWRNWPPERARRLDDICGDLMRKLGFGHEPAWKALIGSDRKEEKPRRTEAGSEG